MASFFTHPTNSPDTLDDIELPGRRDIQQISEPVPILPLDRHFTVQQGELDGDLAAILGRGDERAHVALEDRTWQVQRHAGQCEGAVVGFRLVVLSELADPGVERVTFVAKPAITTTTILTRALGAGARGLLRRCCIRLKRLDPDATPACAVKVRGGVDIQHAHQVELQLEIDSRAAVGAVGGMGPPDDHHRLGRQGRLIVHELGQRILRRCELGLGCCKGRVVVR